MKNENQMYFPTLSALIALLFIKHDFFSLSLCPPWKEVEEERNGERSEEGKKEGKKWAKKAKNKKRREKKERKK